jgi:hypothetical protein
MSSGTVAHPDLFKYVRKRFKMINMLSATSDHPEIPCAPPILVAMPLTVKQYFCNL